MRYHVTGDAGARASATTFFDGMVPPRRLPPPRCLSNCPCPTPLVGHGASRRPPRRASRAPTSVRRATPFRAQIRFTAQGPCAPQVLLNRITGVRGLVARSACDPLEKGKTCATHGSWIHDKTHWVG